MDLETLYKQLWDKSIQNFRSGKFKSDQNINDPSDDRYGLTLLIRPSLKIRTQISEMLNDLRPFAPDQYYYPVSDMHITVLSIISCQPGFTLSQIDTKEYIEVIRSSIGQAAPFQIQFRGLTASPSVLMVCGYPDNKSLNELRNKLRTSFKKTSLYHSIDKRYKLKTAHITALRFRSKISDHQNFTKKIVSMKSNSFGTDTVRELELVGNDWYQKKKNVTLVKKFVL